jgi:pilus assembly protein CpaB
MEKYKPFIFLGLGIIIALLTSVMTYNWLQKNAEGKEIATVATQPVAVAATDLSWGTVVRKEMVKMVPYLKESLPKGHFSDTASLEGRVMLMPLKVDEPFFESRLAPTSITTGGVAAVIKKKKRAMAVKVDKVIGVSGFIHPGNRVDVLVTLKRAGNNNNPITKIVLENILVLAAGTELEKKGKNEKPTPVDVITLEVTPEEAEKLALSATEGKILLALRGFHDKDNVLTRGSSTSSLLASYSLGKNPKKKYRRSTPTYTVELIKGTDKKKVKVKGR